MLKPVTFKVTSDDGSGVAVTASAPDYIEYEMRFNKSVIQGMSDGMWSVYMFIVWHAMHRQGLTALDWEPWLETAPTFDRELESDEPAPLAQEALIGSSPVSQ